MKIKTKKQLNLPQLIEWAWENKIKSHIIRADKQLMNIQFDEHGDFRTYGFTGIGTTFTVEVEEEITEDTVLGKAIEVYSDKYDDFLATSCEGKSLKDILDSNVGNDTKTEKIYLFNDDDTMTLIWRDGKLVE
jgi:hypothetical protein